MLTEAEAKRLAVYSRTRFFRFLVSLRKLTQNISRDSYRFVPDLPLDQTYTDELLYSRYSLDDLDVAFIESLIRSRDEFLPGATPDE